METLHEFDLEVYCNRNRISQAKYEAALDYLRALVFNSDARPSKPIRRWNKELIAKVQDLARDARRQTEDGLDRIERELLSYMNFYEEIAYEEFAPAMDYLRRLSADRRATYPGDKISHELAVHVKDVSSGYPNQQFA